MDPPEPGPLGRLYAAEQRNTYDQHAIFIPDPWAKQKAIVDSLKGWLAETLRDLHPCKQLTQQDVDHPGAGVDFLCAITEKPYGVCSAT